MVRAYIRDFCIHPSLSTGTDPVPFRFVGNDQILFGATFEYLEDVGLLELFSGPFGVMSKKIVQHVQQGRIIQDAFSRHDCIDSRFGSTLSVNRTISFAMTGRRWLL